MLTVELESKYRYRLRMNATHAALLQRVFDANRFVWNHTLGRWNDLWEHEGHRLGFAAACRELTDMRGRFDWLAVEPQTPQQQVIRDLYRSISAYSDKSHPAGRPQFRRKGTRQTARWTKRSFAVSGTALGKVGDRLMVPTADGRVALRVVWSRPLPSVPTSVTVYRDAAGRWWASFAVKTAATPIEESGQTTGLDVGLTTLATGVDPSADVANPRFARVASAALQQVDRSYSRSESSSKRREKARRRRARTHARVAAQRADYFHKEARRLARSYDVIGVEDLRIKNMLANRRLSRAISDAAWGEFIKTLDWQCRKVGRSIEYRDPRNTTQTCSGCGTKAKRRLELKDRVFVCEECGLVIDRDRNAARNLNPGKASPGVGVDGSKTLVPTGTGAA